MDIRSIEFDNPALSDASKKADFFKKMTEGFFNEVSGLIPAHIALKIAADVGETDLPVSNEMLEDLRKRQDHLDAQNDEKHELEMDLMRKQLEAPAAAPAPGGKAPKVPKDDGRQGHAYASKLEQKQHEKVSSGGKQFQRLQKA